MDELILIGNGKLAEAIETGFNKFSKLPVRRYKPEINAGMETVFVHIGSGRQYMESLSQATKLGSSYIQAATEKDVKMDPPDDKKIKYINAPNLDINIIKLFYWLKIGGDLFHREEISIIESHQREKKSRPGTALKFCQYLNLPANRIISIRDPEQQKKLNIKNLKQHAFHQIQIGDEDSKITIETKIEGATSYVKGLARIVDCIARLDRGNYEIEDLIKLKLL